MKQVLNKLSMGRAVILGLVLAAFYYFLLYDHGEMQTALIQEQEQRSVTLQKEIQEAERKLAAAKVYQKTVAEVGGTVEKLTSLIPEQFNSAELMRVVSEEARTAGSSLLALEPKDTAISALAPEFEELTVSVSLQGSFLQHMVFLSNLTKKKQILIARRMTFDHGRESKSDEAPILKLDADLVAYRYRGKVAAPVDGQAPQGTEQAQ